MRLAVVARVGRTARLVLLLCTLIGLTAMHSLGHAGEPTGGQMSAHMALSSQGRPAVPGTDPCAGDGCEHLTTSGGMPHGDMLG